MLDAAGKGPMSPRNRASKEVKVRVMGEMGREGGLDKGCATREVCVNSVSGK